MVVAEESEGDSSITDQGLHNGKETDFEQYSKNLSSAAKIGGTGWNDNGDDGDAVAQLQCLTRIVAKSQYYFVES